MEEKFKYTDEFFREYEEKYIRRSAPVKKVRKSVKKRKKFNFLYFVLPLILILVTVLIIPKNNNSSNTENQIETQIEVQIPKEPIKVTPYNEPTERTAVLSNQINSEFGIFINADSGEILATKKHNSKMYPASLTKIMTALVAIESIKDINDTFELSYKIIDPLYRRGASLAGFSSGEEVKLIDLLYGTILPSGAEACSALAVYVSGSEKEFVELMNEKAKELGLERTHFANPHGLYDDNNYTTAYDMALILKAATENELLNKILSTHQYITSPTPEHPEGIEFISSISKYLNGLSTENGSSIFGGKTGFVNESGNCVASFGISLNGDNYICVTGKAESARKSGEDHIHIYSNYAN